MRLLLGLLAFLLFSTEILAQAVCPQAPVLAKSARGNIFSEQQEVYLGDVAAEAFAYSLRVIEDEALVAPLRRMGARLVRQMPENQLDHRFFLIDDPSANAFAVAGGRVYVTRTLITSTRSEDELAGVLAHEMGHQLNHDSAILFSKAFKAYLNVTSLADRDDVENKYHQFLDSYRTKQISLDVDSEKGQLNADHGLSHTGYRNLMSLAHNTPTVFAKNITVLRGALAAPGLEASGVGPKNGSEISSEDETR